MRPQQVLASPVRLDLRVIIRKGYFTLCRAPELEPHHQMQFNVIFRTLSFWGREGVLLLCRGYSQRILSFANRTGSKYGHNEKTVSILNFLSDTLAYNIWTYTIKHYAEYIYIYIHTYIHTHTHTITLTDTNLCHTILQLPRVPGIR